jgi:hypothetical protein
MDTLATLVLLVTIATNSRKASVFYLAERLEASQGKLSSMELADHYTVPETHRIDLFPA